MNDIIDWILKNSFVIPIGAIGFSLLYYYLVKVKSTKRNYNSKCARCGDSLRSGRFKENIAEGIYSDYKHGLVDSGTYFNDMLHTVFTMILSFITVYIFLQKNKIKKNNSKKDIF